MEQNKIHIDELVRRRLGGGEEEPRPGAWLAMRDLLDARMPVKPAGGFAWGKAARWTSALLLMTLMAGGYSVMMTREARLAEDAVRPVALANGPAKPGVASTTSRSANRTATTGSASKQGSSTTPSNGAPDRGNEMRTAGTLAIADASTPSSNPSTSNTSANPATVPNGSVASPVSTSRASGRASSAQTNTGTSGQSRETIASNSSRSRVAATEGTNRSSNSSSETSRNSRATAAATRRNSARASENRDELRTVSSATRNAKRSARPAQMRNVVPGPTPRVDSAKMRVLRDTVQPIHIAYRYLRATPGRSGRYVVDTIADPMYVIERLEPIQPPVIASAPAKARRRSLFRFRKPAAASTATTPVVAAAPVPASAPAAANAAPDAGLAAKESVTMLPLSQYRVSSSKHSSMSFSAQEQLQDAARRARFAIAQMRFYGGVTGGVNASFQTPIVGFQIGLTGLLTLNERFAIGAEGKFVQRFNRGTEIRDPYFKVDAVSEIGTVQQGGQQYSIYRTTMNNRDHYFKVATLEGLEMPLYLRYTYGRFHGFGGANFSYGLRIKSVENVDQLHNRVNVLDTVLSSIAFAPQGKQSAEVTVDDFGPRFGIGWTAGLAYQATPSVLMDVRMTQLAWDNRSNTSGGLRVSQTFYRIPSLQVSVGYRFSQRSGRR